MINLPSKKIFFKVCKEDDDGHYANCLQGGAPKSLYIDGGHADIKGRYVRRGNHDGKSYFVSDGNYMYYSTDDEMWMISTKLGGETARAFVEANGSDLPTDLAGWRVWSKLGKDFTHDKTMLVTSKAPEVTETTAGPESFSPYKQPRSAAVGVRMKDGSEFSPFAQAKDGPVGIRRRDSDELFSPFKYPTVQDGPVGVRSKEGSAIFSPFKNVGETAAGPVGVRPRDGYFNFSI